MHYLDGYITVTRLTDWSRAFYCGISPQITHGSLVLRVHLTFEAFRTRPSTRVGIDTRLFERFVFSVSVVIYVICVKRMHQFLRTVGMVRESIFTNVGSEKVCSSVN